jgi:hypothetical protein
MVSLSVLRLPQLLMWQHVEWWAGQLILAESGWAVLDAVRMSACECGIPAIFLCR